MVFAVTAAVVGGAIGKSNQKKAYERSKRDADLQKLIDGSSPSISAAEGVDAESFQVAGTEVADIDKAIEQSYYGGTPPSEEILAVPEEVPPEELAMLLQSNPELFQDQGIMGMASGGAVGTPEDVYYFGVPQIMGMMQDPNPQIQEVGMQLADQMERMPDAGMVPATANQIQSMAYGGAVTAKKLRDGGPPQTGSRTDQNLERIEQIIKESGRSKLLSQLGLSDDFGRVDQEDRLLNELIEKLNLPVDIEKEGDNYSVSKTFADEDASLQLGATRRGMSAGDQYIPPGETSFYIKGEKRFADGGPITSERLNQLRRR